MLRFVLRDADGLVRIVGWFGGDPPPVLPLVTSDYQERRYEYAGSSKGRVDYREIPRSDGRVTLGVVVPAHAVPGLHAYVASVGGIVANTEDD